jgi:hypothetical protein
MRLQNWVIVHDSENKGKAENWQNDETRFASASPIPVPGTVRRCCRGDTVYFGIVAHSRRKQGRSVILV